MIGQDISQTFDISHRLRNHYLALRLPLQIYQRPSPELRALYSEAMSHLRFVGLGAGGRWRFTLFLANAVEDGAGTFLFPSLPKGPSWVLMNLSAQTGFEAHLKRPLPWRVTRATVAPLTAVAVKGGSAQTTCELSSLDGTGLISLLIATLPETPCAVVSGQISK